MMRGAASQAARRSRAYNLPNSGGTPVSSWIEQRRRAAVELAQARTRLALVQQGVLAGSESAARDAVAAAERRAATVLWLSYKPGEAAQAGVESPVPAMLREATASNQALTVNPHGYVEAIPLLTPRPPREATLVLAPDEVRDMDGLLAAGYQIYQPPNSQELILWPRLDAPDVQWINGGTPGAQIDQAAERRRLAARRVITPPRPARPRPVRSRQQAAALRRPVNRRRPYGRRRE